MKRFLATILAVIYLSISSGMVVNIHYCMGKFSSAKLAVLPGKTCGCGKMETKGCCKTESKLVKLEDAQKAAYADFAIQAPVAILHYTGLNLLQTSFHKGPDNLSPQVHAPPLLSEQDTYLQNCVFRI
jgi:hypothetical protein